MIIPIAKISKKYIVKLRINYDGNYYYEKFFKNPA